MTDYPVIPDQVIGWGPGLFRAASSDAEVDTDIDACLSLYEGGPGVTPDGDPTTVGSIGVHGTESKGDPVVSSTFIEVTAGDCVNLATRLLSLAIQDDDVPRLPGPDPEGEHGDFFDAFEIEWVGEYEAYAGDTRFCEVISSNDPDVDPGEEERVNLMVSLYGHFSTGGVHSITDSIVTDENTREQALDYIRRLANSIAAGRPVNDYT